MIAERKHLTGQLSLVKKAMGRSTVNVLNCVRLTCHDGVVTVSATDLEIAATIPVVAIEAPSNFDLLLPVKEFEELLKATSSTRVWIDETDDPERYVMLADGTKLDTPVTAWIEPEHKLDDFPLTGRIEQPEQVVTIMVSELSAALAVVGPSASKDESRPVLTGICIDVEEDNTTINLASTDSYRLHVVTTEGISSGECKQRLVPARFLKLVEAYAKKDGQETVSFRFGPVKGMEPRAEAVFEKSAAVIGSRLIGGQFPNYKQLIPEGFDYLAGFDAEQLLIGLKQVVALGASKHSPAILHVADDGWHCSEQQGKGSIHLSKANGGPWPEVGTAFGYNPEFLAGAVKAMGDETVIVEMTNPLRPCLVSAKGSTKKMALVMPIRLNDWKPPVQKGKVAVRDVPEATEPEPEAPAKRETGVNSPTNQFLIEANLAMAKHYKVTDMKSGPERTEKELQRTYHNGLVAWYLGKRKTQPTAGDLAPGKASVVKARVTRIATKHGLSKP